MSLDLCHPTSPRCSSSGIKARRRLFMTATPRYFTGRVLKAAQEAEYEVASMDDEANFGTVFHRLSFSEAIERDLLTDYQVAVVGVDDNTYRSGRRRARSSPRRKESHRRPTLAGQIGLAKAMRKYDLRRGHLVPFPGQAGAGVRGPMPKSSRGCLPGSARRARRGRATHRVR